MEELNKTYKPANFEDKIYKMWDKSGYFHPEPDETKEAFTIVIPPPNITAKLHIGHALDETLQDILARFNRMRGKNVLWLPGTDHASIATEVKIVQNLEKEGLKKEQIGRDEFLKRAWQWKEKYGGKIIEQLKKLGASCDWKRLRFTLDEGCSNAVREAFVSWYEKGYIYRGKRIVNWCPKCLTSISDAEVEYSERESYFWHIKYPFSEGDGFIEIATTRPETMLGDTAVAVNPKDKRYKGLVGKMVKLPLTNREIPIVEDDYVDVDFGSGAVKITPAHDPNDFEVGKRHNLSIIDIFTDDGKLKDNCGKYAGMDRYKARQSIETDLKELGFIIKKEPYSHNVGECYRCHTAIEPKISTQWFVKMQDLAKPAIEAVKRGEVEFIPKRFEKVYFHWMDNIKDWCISRQLFWGHRIPAWYCQDCGEMTVQKTRPEKCPKCQSLNLNQDEDTLDTWFSSALWPYSTLGWPEQTADLEHFFPTSVLVTAYDIIFFWVARMIFSSLENTGKVPFKKVLMHGLVRDEQGRKMSKSLGNGVDPLEIVDKYGADALRFMLAGGTNTGNDMRYSEQKVVSARNYANKLWNAARFILMNLDQKEDLLDLPSELLIEDMWFLTKLNDLVVEVTDNLENFEISVAAQKIYDFSWDILCDWYIEICKIKLNKDKETALNAQKLMIYGLCTTLKLLHPFMPFVTEEIYSKLPKLRPSIMIEQWPNSRPEFTFRDEEKDFEKTVEVIKGIRNLRAEKNLKNSKKISVYIKTKTPQVFEKCKDIIVKLVFASNLEIKEEIKLKDAVLIPTTYASVFVPLDDLIDKKEEILKLQRERKQILKQKEGVDKKLNNPSFLDKAPETVVNKEKEKLKRVSEKLEQIDKSISALK